LHLLAIFSKLVASGRRRRRRSQKENSRIARISRDQKAEITMMGKIIETKIMQNIPL